MRRTILPVVALLALALIALPARGAPDDAYLCHDRYGETTANTCAGYYDHGGACLEPRHGATSTYAATSLSHGARDADAGAEASCARGWDGAEHRAIVVRASYGGDGAPQGARAAWTSSDSEHGPHCAYGVSTPLAWQEVACVGGVEPPALPLLP